MKSLPDHYETLPADEKLALLWGLCSEAPYDESSLPWQNESLFYASIARRGFFTTKHLAKTLMHERDESPDLRRKTIHPFGAVAPIEYLPEEGHPFTGLYASRCIGVTRLAVAIPRRNFTPTTAVKLLVDGQPSCHCFAIPALTGQGLDHDFFANSGDNTLDYAKGAVLKIVERAFNKTLRRQGLKHSTSTLHSADHPAQVHPDGTLVDSPRAPRILAFQPATKTPSDPNVDFRKKLIALEPGTTLYRLSGRPTLESEPIPLGSIRTTAKFVASQYADERLFFQHDGFAPRTWRSR